MRSNSSKAASIPPLLFMSNTSTVTRNCSAAGRSFCNETSNNGLPAFARIATRERCGRKSLSSSSLFQIDVLRGEARDISTGAREVGDDTDANRIANGTHHDRYRFRCLLRRQCSRSAPRDDQINRKCSQFGRHVGIAIIATLCKARYQPQILAFDIAIVPQLAREPLDRRQGLGGKDPDRPHVLALLRARRERPRGGRAAEQSDEIAPRDHSMTSSARASSVGGTSRPRAFAVLRLIANSYLVGCCTGRSAGLAPLRISST